MHTKYCANHHHYLSGSGFCAPKGNPYPLSSQSSFTPPLSPCKPLIYFLSLWICLLWIFYINGIIQYLTFCDWLLSFSIIFSGFIYVIAYISTSFLFLIKNIPSYGYIIYVYPFINWYLRGGQKLYIKCIYINWKMHPHLQKAKIWQNGHLKIEEVGSFTEKQSI